MNLLGKATFSRADIREDMREPFVAFLDEFEQFINHEDELRTYLEMARSLGLSIVLAHQSVEQIPPSFLGMIRDNTFTQISLMVGPDSAKKVKDIFPNVDTEDLTGLEQYTGYGLFKKLNPMPFTFETMNIKDLFEENAENDIKKFIFDFKKKHYTPVSSVKREIAARYQFIKEYEMFSGNSTMQKGDASGKVRRKN